MIKRYCIICTYDENGNPTIMRMPDNTGDWVRWEDVKEIVKMESTIMDFSQPPLTPERFYRSLIENAEHSEENALLAVKAFFKPEAVEEWSKNREASE